MVASRRNGLRPGGVVRAIGRLVVLVGLGFGAGLVIGVVSEEPELLAGHLRGEGQSIELTASMDAAGETDPPIANRSEAAPTDPQLSPPAAANSAPTKEDSRDRVLPAVAAGPPPTADSISANARASEANGWAIQVGAFTDEVAAKRLSDGLIAKGYPAKLVHATNELRWRVRVQPIRDQKKATEMADHLKRIERLPTWVMPMEAR